MKPTGTQVINTLLFFTAVLVLAFSTTAQAQKINNSSYTPRDHSCDFTISEGGRHGAERARNFFSWAANECAKMANLHIKGFKCDVRSTRHQLIDTRVTVTVNRPLWFDSKASGGEAYHLTYYSIECAYSDKTLNQNLAQEEKEKKEHEKLAQQQAKERRAQLAEETKVKESLFKNLAKNEDLYFSCSIDLKRNALAQINQETNKQALAQEELQVERADSNQENTTEKIGMLDKMGASIASFFRPITNWYERHTRSTELYETLKIDEIKELYDYFDENGIHSSRLSNYQINGPELTAVQQLTTLLLEGYQNCKELEKGLTL